jgi:hypothetical protein
VDGKMVTLADFNLLWPVVDPHEPASGVIEPFISVLAAKSLCAIETSLKLLCEKSRLAYLPLDKYDIDIDLARRCAADICRRWCVLPIDSMSKATLIATANPYNRTAAREMEEALGTRVIWYISPPQDLMKAVKKTFR